MNIVKNRTDRTDHLPLVKSNRILRGRAKHYIRKLESANVMLARKCVEAERTAATLRQACNEAQLALATERADLVIARETSDDLCNRVGWQGKRYHSLRIRMAKRLRMMRDQVRHQNESVGQWYKIYPDLGGQALAANEQVRDLQFELAGERRRVHNLAAACRHFWYGRTDADAENIRLRSILLSAGQALHEEGDAHAVAVMLIQAADAGADPVSSSSSSSSSSSAVSLPPPPEAPHAA